MEGRIPAIISIDVEPDGFQAAGGGALSTRGYDAMATAMARLRPLLHDATGRPPAFGWFFRMDPQIAAHFGRADHLVSGFEKRVAGLIGIGDHVGVHTHPLRWSDERQTWIHDVTDASWTAELYGSSFEAFERWFGESCRRHRAGAALFHQGMIDELDRLGVEVEAGLEPVRGWGVGAVEVLTGVDASPLAVPNVDCSGAPSRPYRPAPGSFLQPGRRTEGMVLLPVTTTWMSLRRPAWQTLIGAAVRTRSAPIRRMLYPTSRVPARDFWDLVSRQLRFMRRPYVNVGFRTDDPDSPEFRRALAVLEGLAVHPLAARLEIVDPLVALPWLSAAGGWFQPALEVQSRIP